MDLPDFLTQDSDGYIHLTGHRIGVQDVIEFYREGFSPEMLVGQFPTLSLSLIHRTIAFYLDNQVEVDAYSARSDLTIDRQRAVTTSGPDLAELRRRMQAVSHTEGV